jgi:glycolate oxidase FAD binding subunit
VTSPPTDRSEVLHALVEICGPDFAREAGHADTIAGSRARFVAAPATTAGVIGILRLAAEHDLTVVPRGAGTKIDWGVPPPGVHLLLDTGRLAGIWNHRPDEFSAEVGVGTPVRAVQAALALRGQRLAVDPPSPGATLGGVLSVNESGPLRHRFGSPDEQVRRYTWVDPSGTPGESAGGAADRPDDRPDDTDGPPPGVLISAGVRLQPLPDARRWVTYPVSNPLQVHNVVAGTLDAEVSPSAIEVDLPAPTPPGGASPRFGSAPQLAGTVAVLLEGGPVSVRERAARLVAGLTATLGGDPSVTGIAPTWWGRYPFGPDDVVLRLTVSSADLHAAVYALRDAAGGAVPVRGSAGVGTVHAVLSGRTEPSRVEGILDAVRGVLLARGGRCVVVSAPPAVRAVVDIAGRSDLF